MNFELSVDRIRQQPDRLQKLLLFDIDGTLLLTQGGSLRAMTRAARHVFSPSFDLSRVDRFGRLDSEIVESALQINHCQATTKQIELFKQLYFSELRREMSGMRALPGVLALLMLLRDRKDVVLGLLTGNFGPAAEIKLSAVGIDVDWFPVRCFGEEATRRMDLIPLALERAAKHAGKAIPVERVVVVGDTPRDVDCAKTWGCRVVAVATGAYPVAVLRETGADLVLEDFGNPQSFLRFLDSLG